MYPQNRVVKAFEEGRKSYGLYLHSPSKKMIELMGAAGMDFVRLDLEGGVYDMETLANLIMIARACGVTPFVRIFPLDKVLIKKVISMGAMGIQLPEIKGYEDVELGVMAAKVAPIGGYVSGGSPFGGYGALNEVYCNWARKNIIVSVQIEQREAVKDLDAILEVPGLDMICSGRGSLARSYGISSQYHPEIIEIERQTMRKALDAGKIASVCYSVMDDDGLFERVREFGKMGVSAFAFGGDNGVASVLRNLTKRANDLFR